MKDERTYCPHCWTEVSKDDTTCHMCGEGIEHTPTDSTPDSERDTTVEKIIFVVIGSIIGGLFTAWMKGELPL